MAKVSSFQLFYPPDFARSVDVQNLEVARSFAVSLRNSAHFGNQIEFQIAPGRTLDPFPYIDHAESVLPGLLERIRSTTCDAPLYDIDEGWQLMVFRKEGWFVVLLGDDGPMGAFLTRLRVPAGEFIDAWEQLVSITCSER